MLGFKSVEYGEFLDTKGVAISYVLKNPIFRDTDNDGSFVFNTTIPASDRNKKLCKFPLRVEAFREMTTDTDIEVYFNGALLWNGTLIAKFARPGEIEVQIGIGRGELNYEAEGKKLADLLPDENHTIGHVERVRDPVTDIPHDTVIVDQFDDVPNHVYPDINYAVFPMKIEDLCSAMGNAFNNAYYNTSSNVNMWDMELQKFMHPFVTGNQYLLISSIDDTDTHTHHLTYLLPYNIFIPFPYNSWVLKNIFKTLGYFIENNPFEIDADLKRMVIYNIQALNQLKNENQGPWTQQITGDPEYGDYTLTTKRYLYALENMTNFNLKSHVPDIEAKNYLRSLENLLFFRFFIDNKTRKVTVKFLKEIILDTNYTDITHKVIEVSEKRMEYDKIARIIQKWDGNDGNGSFIRTQEEIDEFSRINDVWYYGDLPANPFGQYENKISYGQLQKKWFVCSSFADDFNHISTWDLLAFEHYAEKKLLDEGKNWETDASAPACSHFVDFRPGTSFVKYAWHLANTKQGLKFYNAYKTDEKECGLRFLFYRGLQPGHLITDGVKIVCTITHTHDIVSGGVIYAAIGYLENNSPISHNNAIIACWHIADAGMTLSEAMAYLMTFYVIDHISTSVFQHFFNTYVTTYETTVQISDEVKLYPLGTNDVYDGQLTKIPEANLSLKWDGQYGIFNKYAKEFIYWFNNLTKPVTIKFQPTTEDLFIDFSKWFRIAGKDFLIDEIRGTIKDDVISEAEADAWSR